MRIVIALGGNALLRRGQPMTADNQRANIRIAAERLGSIAAGNELIVAHGNGPQVGLLALQAAAYHDVAPYPLDILGAQTDAMIGYVVEQELANVLPRGPALATVLTMVEVDLADPAFRHPTKPIGPVYDVDTAKRVAAESGWVIAADGEALRRVVPSPKPRRFLELDAIRRLVDAGTIVICAGGGGIPTAYDRHGALRGVEAVVDKDLASALLAEQLDADLLVIATDVDGVYANWAGPEQIRLDHVTPDDLAAMTFPTGSMGPKVEAACQFARNTCKPAVIGALEDIVEIVAGAAGTTVSMT